MKYTKKEKEKALDSLRRWIKPGDTVYTILRSVSPSGMSRVISVVVNLNGDMIHPNYSVAVALDMPITTKNGSDGVNVSGCGMDMGFHIVYNLAATLWPKGDGVTVTGRNGSTEPETDGGYLLKQRWL